jgi:hypothetical protein
VCESGYEAPEPSATGLDATGRCAAPSLHSLSSAITLSTRTTFSSQSSLLTYLRRCDSRIISGLPPFSAQRQQRHFWPAGAKHYGEGTLLCKLTLSKQINVEHGRSVGRQQPHARQCYRFASVLQQLHLQLGRIRPSSTTNMRVSVQRFPCLCCAMDQVFLPTRLW